MFATIIKNNNTFLYFVELFIYILSTSHSLEFQPYHHRILTGSMTYESFEKQTLKYNITNPEPIFLIQIQGMKHYTILLLTE